MTTQLEQDVALAASVGFHQHGVDFSGTCLEIHAFANAIREQAVPDGYVLMSKDLIELAAQCLYRDAEEGRQIADVLLNSAAPTRGNE